DDVLEPLRDGAAATLRRLEHPLRGLLLEPRIEAGITGPGLEPGRIRDHAPGLGHEDPDRDVLATHAAGPVARRQDHAPRRRRDHPEPAFHRRATIARARAALQARPLLGALVPAGHPLELREG